MESFVDLNAVVTGAALGWVPPLWPSWLHPKGANLILLDRDWAGLDRIVA